MTQSVEYRNLLNQISQTFAQGRAKAVQAVNAQLVETYWQVGRQIVEFEQGGKVRADYGKALIQNLAHDLSLEHGKGFSRSNLIRFRQFYQVYPNGATLSHLLTWSPSKSRPQLGASLAGRAAAGSAAASAPGGSCCATLRIPCALVIVGPYGNSAQQ